MGQGAFSMEPLDVWDNLGTVSFWNFLIKKAFLARFDFDNCLFSSGLFGTFCFPCQVCQSANRLHENCCFYGVLSLFCPCIAVSMLRTNVRDKYEISGTTMNDCCCGWCCTPCVSCQVANEIETRNQGY